jgi:PKD repeat protein
MFPTSPERAPRRVRRRVLLALLLGAFSCGGGSGGGGGVRADFASDLVHGRAPLRVSFRDLSSGPVTSWSWDFGDGTQSAEREPVHEYALPGTYDVALTVGGAGRTHVLARRGWIETRASSAYALEYGMNPSFARWTSREIVFADAMMRATEFVVVRAGELTLERAPLVPLGAEPARLGEGWPDFAQLAPGEGAGAWLFGAMDGTLPDGRTSPYVLTWEGGGQCVLVGSAVLGEVRRGPRRFEVFVDPEVGRGNGTVALAITSSSPADPVRNVHVWLPGTYPTRPLFHEPYVARVQALNHGEGPFTWRTLDWTRINDYGATDPPLPFTFDLAGAIRPDSPSQGTRRGMCPEFQVAFCNRVGANLHFQVPHRAEPMPPEDYERFLRDAFVRIRDGSPAVAGINGGRPFEGLALGLELTLEYSNEVWNATPANRWLLRQAALRGLTLHEVLAEELLAVWRIADEVFAGHRTVRRFLGGFVAQPDFLRRVLAALPPDTHIDALGPSCYFRPRPAAIGPWLEDAEAGRCPNCPTPAEVVAAALDSLDELRPLLAEHREIARAHRNPDGTHPRFELYECGQSFDARGEPWGPAARAAQRLPEMYSAYVDGLVPLLVEEGVELVNWYSFMSDPDPSGGVDVGFGILEDMAQPLTLPVPEPYVHEGAPKAAAVYRGPPRL